MSEIRKPLANALDDVRNGELPLDTAEQMHKIAHRHVMDRYADDREARRIGDEKLAEKLTRAQEKIKSL